MNNPDAILTSDWHIRGDRPLCRTDNYMDAQAEKLGFIFKLAHEYECPILVGGDFGHRPFWGDKLLNWFTDVLHGWNIEIFVVAGQHDLPNHRLDKWNEGGLGNLHRNNWIKVIREDEIATLLKGVDIFSFPYSTRLETRTEKSGERFKSVALAHQMVIKTPVDKLWHEQKANSAKKLLKQIPCYDLIVTGDNHQSFAVEYEGRWLVNPGSIMRMTSAQVTHQPSIYEWYAKDNSINRVLLPVEDDVIDTSHITEVKERDERIEAFVNKLGGDYDVGFSFEDNLKKFLANNRNKKGVVEKIWQSLNLERG